MNISPQLETVSKNPAMGQQIKSTIDFYLKDFNKTLFPLKTNRELIIKGEPEIQEYINNCLDGKNKTFSFSSQQRVYAAKTNMHLRRTVKLDPVADYYLYDLMYKNKNLLRKPFFKNRTHYGYRFENGNTISPSEAYKAFKAAISEYSNSHAFSMSMDVASYFNSVYHHDLVSWFGDLNASNTDVIGLGQILREANYGKSIDCLPQGLYPTKMIGNDFLRFIENFHELKSDQIVRFMDDIYIFSNNQQHLNDDFQVIQKLLGEKGLSVNPKKTIKNLKPNGSIDNKIDEIKQRLLQRRRFLFTEGYDADGEEVVKELMLKWPLTSEEVEYINSILDNENIEEEDAELILTIMRDNTHKVEKRLPYIIQTYPHLIKSISIFCNSIPDKETVAEIIFDALNRDGHLMEFQLFWFAAILEEQLMGTNNASRLISLIFNHRSATPITQAKILEIDDRRFGLPDLRSRYLTTGRSDWLAWASAVGSRSLNPISIRHRLKYFGNSSQMNHLIATILSKD